MDGIGEIRAAETAAERIRRDALDQAGAIVGSAEGEMANALETARREGGEDAERKLAEAGEQAQARLSERAAVADIQAAELREKAAGKMDAAAAWLAKMLSEV